MPMPHKTTPTITAHSPLKRKKTGTEKAAIKVLICRALTPNLSNKWPKSKVKGYKKQQSRPLTPYEKPLKDNQ